MSLDWISNFDLPDLAGTDDLRDLCRTVGSSPNIVLDGEVGLVFTAVGHRNDQDKDYIVYYGKDWDQVYQDLCAMAEKVRLHGGVGGQGRALSPVNGGRAR